MANKKKDTTGKENGNEKQKMETSSTEVSKAVKMVLAVSAETETIRSIFPEEVLLAIASAKTASAKFAAATDALTSIQKHAAANGVRVDWSGTGGRLRFDRVDAQGRPCGRLGRISAQGGILILKGSNRVSVKIGLVPAAE